MTKKLTAKVVNLIIDENLDSPGQKRLLKRKIEKLEKRGRLTTDFLKNKDKDQVEWAFRIFSASMMLGDYSWWGWETRSGWAWTLANKDWFYPRWHGQRCKLLVLAEQGIGDEILFISAAKDLAKDADVFWEADNRLIPILKRSIPEVNWITRWKDDELREPWQLTDHRGEYDAFIPAGNVPKLYRPTKKSFPREPYLIPDWDRVAEWQEKIEGVGFVNKAGVHYDKRAAVPGDHDLHHHSPLYRQHDYFDDYISMIVAMDYVNAVPSAVVHICGATGQYCNVIKPRREQGNMHTALKWYYGKGVRTMDWYGDWVQLYENINEFEHHYRGFSPDSRSWPLLAGGGIGASHRRVSGVSAQVL